MSYEHTNFTGADVDGPDESEPKSEIREAVDAILQYIRANGCDDLDPFDIEKIIKEKVDEFQYRRAEATEEGIRDLLDAALFYQACEKDTPDREFSPWQDYAQKRWGKRWTQADIDIAAWNADRIIESSVRFFNPAMDSHTDSDDDAATGKGMT